MRGCLRVLGIILGVSIVSAGLFALFFWLDWKREKELFDQAWHAYHDGNPAEALTLYQELLERKGLSEAQQRDARDQADELADYLNALSLQEKGMAEESITAYETYLQEHRVCSMPDNFYCSLTRRALAILRPELAQVHLQNGEYAQAIETYLALLSMELIGETECGPAFPGDDRGVVCLEAETAVANGHATAQASIPAVLHDWVVVLGRERNYQDAVEWCEDAFEEFPSVLNDEQVNEIMGQLYSDWAADLRQAENYPESIEKFQIVLNLYSDTSVAPTAREELHDIRQEYDAWLEANPAIPVLEVPAEVSRDSEDRWAWTTVFKETSGKVGYTVSGTGWIEDANGARYGPWGSEVTRGTVTVPAGGQAEDSYWVRGERFEGGYAVISWTGEDEGGHPITIEEKVHLLP